MDSPGLAGKQVPEMTSLDYVLIGLLVLNLLLLARLAYMDRELTRIERGIKRDLDWYQSIERRRTRDIEWAESRHDDRPADQG